MRLRPTFFRIKAPGFQNDFTFDNLLFPRHLAANLRSNALLNARLKAAVIHEGNISVGI